MIFFAERFKYTKGDFSKKFEPLEKSLADELYEYLNKKRLIVPVRKDDYQGVELEPDEATDSFSFRFVGLIIFKDISLFVYPKYYLFLSQSKEEKELCDQLCEEKVRNGEFPNVVKAIEKYRNKKYMMQDSFLESDSDNKSLLALMLFFIFDYYENGIYLNRKWIRERNGFGEVIWEDTINSFDPIFKNGKPFYVDLITDRMVSNDDNIVSRIHRKVIVECSDSLEKSGIIKFLNLSSVDDIVPIEFGSLGDLDYQKRCLKSELAIQFNTKKRTLIKNLINYLDDSDNRHGYESEPMFFGTVNFHALWEDAVNLVLGNHKHKSFSIIKEGESSDIKIIDAIHKPIYTIDEKEYPVDTLIPDCIHIENKNFFIIDAKYYCYRTLDRNIYNAPGVADINKQYLYQLAYKKHMLNVKYHNYFIMPAILDTDMFFERKGSIHMPIFNDFEYPDLKDTLGLQLCNIEIFHLSAPKVIDSYLKSEYWNHFYKMILSD